MVQKEESVEGLRNKNILRLTGAQSGGGVCRQPGGQQGHQETGRGRGGGVLLAGRRPGHTWKMRSDCQLAAVWWGDYRRGGGRVTAWHLSETPRWPSQAVAVGIKD